jgi:hypothetical protein
LFVPFRSSISHNIISISISIGIRNRNVNNGGNRRISIGSARSEIVGKHFLNLEVGNLEILLTKVKKRRNIY